MMAAILWKIKQKYDMYRRYKFKLQKLVCTAALCNYNVLLSLGDRGYS